MFFKFFYKRAKIGFFYYWSVYPVFFCKKNRGVARNTPTDYYKE